MKAFMIPLTVASSDARIYVNPDHIIFIREVSNGTQLLTTMINEGAVMPVVKEKPEEVYMLCRLARTEEESDAT